MKVKVKRKESRNTKTGRKADERYSNEVKNERRKENDKNRMELWEPEKVS
jgi:hypothetical protein